MRLFFSLLFSFVTFSVLNSQSQYDIRLQLSSIDCDTKVACYNVQLKASSSTWGLAGQNYRIFYDASVADYLSGTKVLGSEYGDFTLVQDVTADATGVGPLTFESTLGFLNYAIDLNDIVNGGIFLTTDWTTTSNICFTLAQDPTGGLTECMDVVWGREGLTDPYATAFVEVSRWVGTNNTTNTVGSLYDDLNSGDGNEACFNTSCAACEKPVLTIGDFTCNGNTYSVNFFHNGQTISANAGTVSGNSVINIPIGTNVSITSSNGTGCTTVLTYTSPASCVTLCSYPDLTVGEGICNGLTYTVSLTETTGATITVSAGTRVGNTVINIPIGTNVSITATNGTCVSQIAVTSPTSCTDPCNNPPISISGPVCTNNNANYGVNYTTITGATVTASHGTVNNGVISGIPAGQALTITVSFAGCTNEVVVVPAPACTCEKPVLTIGDLTCNGNTYHVNFFHNGQTISANAGTVSGNSVINIPIGTNVLISSSNGTGCMTMLTYNSPASCVTTCSYPDLTVGEGICIGTTYTVSFTETSGATISVSAGTRVANTVINIPIGTNVTITATNGACVSQIAVTSPASCIDPCSNPPISISGPVCTNNNANYSVNYTTITGATVTASHGTVNNGVISGIPAGQALTITVSFAGCTNEVVVVPAPACTCEKPVLTIGDFTCNGNTYHVNFFHNGQTISANAGTVSGNSVINIPIGTNVVITSSNGTGCTTILTYTSPASCVTTCNYPDLSVGQAICVGTTYTVSLTETTGASIVLSVGTRVANTVINIPIGTNLTITATNGACVSQIVVTSPVSCIDPCSNPPISISGPVCTNNNTNYSVNYTTISGATVTASHGTVNNGVISGVPASQTLTITVTFAGCANEVVVVPAPVCTCETPVLTTGDITCNGNTYSVIFFHNGQTFTASAGTVSGNNIINIPIGTNVVLTSSNGTGCSSIITVASPASCPTNCSFPDLTVGQAICVGQTYNVSLKENTGATVTVSAGTRVGNMVINIPIGTNVTITGTNGACVSQVVVTSPVSCTDPCNIPPISISGRICSNNSTSYTVNYSTISGATVTANVGTVNNGIVSGIPAGQAVTITVFFGGCTNEIIVVPAPVCTCEKPLLTIGEFMCIGANYRVEFIHNGQTISASAGTVSGNSVINIPIGTNVVITSSNGTGCETVLTYNSPASCITTCTYPDLTVGEGICVGTSYTVSLTESTGATLTVSAGTRVGNTLINIPLGTNVTITAINGACVSQIVVTSPTSCNDVCRNPPISISGRVCSSDNTSYSINYTTIVGATVTSTLGTVGNGIISGIPTGLATTITATFAGCASEVVLVPALICPRDSDYNIRMVLDTVNCIENKFCYEVQLSSANGFAMNLAGQNYRLYYDGSKMSYLSGTSLLPVPTYTNYTLAQIIENQDASATNGALSFEANLSFLNYSMDLNDLVNGGVILPANGSWVGTSELCFNAAFDLSDAPLTCIEAVWARTGLTDPYATAFVEVAKWVGVNNTVMAIGSMYDDISLSDPENVCNSTLCLCETPVLTTGDIRCNGNTYSFSFIHNGQTITTNAGTISGNNVINIPIGTNVIITSSNGLGCSTVLNVTSPLSCPTSCSFPDLTVGEGICVGNAYTVSLTETTGATITVSAGTRVGNTVINIPIGTNITITATNGACVSQIVIISPTNCIDPCSNPPISISGPVCTNNNTNYTVNYTTITGATVTASHGTVNNGVISGVPVGQALTITVTFAGCADEVVIVPAPTCTCEKPVLTIGDFTCNGNTYNVNFFNNGQTISANAGTVSGNSVINIPIGTNVAITSSNGAGCTSILTYTSPASCVTTCSYPDLTVGEGICVGTTYTVSLTETTGATITLSAGTRVGNTVINIPIGTNVTITATNGACISQTVVTSPASCIDLCSNPAISI
ncbi:MAG TPA: hypothetical protein VK169_03330, partial [Saprospiraceae bacterium]|nr:hypothetical protein [Saprospiraceae bacterium]